MSTHALVADNVRRPHASDRARPICSNQLPIGFGAVPLKLLRRAARWLKTALAQVRFTVVAAKSRRLQRELSLRGVHYQRDAGPSRVVRGRS